MAVQKMKLVYLTGQFEKLDALTKKIIDCDYFQPEIASEIMSSNNGFSSIIEENPYSANLSRLQDIMDSFGLTAKVGKSPKKYISENTAENLLKNTEDKLKEIHSSREEMAEAVSNMHENISNIEKFTNLNIDLQSILNTNFVHARFGRLPKSSTEKLKMYKNNPYAVFFVSSSDGDYDWGIYFCPDDNPDDVDRLFASLFFEKINLPNITGTPKDILENLTDTEKILQEKLNYIENEINKYVSANEKSIVKLYNQIKHQHDAFALRRYAAKYNDKSFVLVGWVPETKKGVFSGIVSSVGDISVEFDNPESVSKLKPPTKLKNSFFFRPFQYYVEIYGMPNYSEIDPTAFVAITYTILYGIMFADLGQGILLSIVGFLMYKLKKMPLGKILVPCGLSGAFFGLVFGSVFGFEDALNPLYKAIGFDEKPIDIMENAMTLLIFSVGIGVGLIIVAMIFNIFSKLKQRRFGEVFFSPNGLAGLVLYVMILLLALGSVIGISLPTLPCVLLGIVLPLLVIFLKNPLTSLIEGKGFKIGSGFGDFLIENFFELFEVILGYLTNTISFLRVGAFVLIHVGMMTAFFALAEIMGGKVGYVIMIVFGNIFVLALEGLLVGIQTLRLEFYEMFSRFYDGNGVKFTPVKINK